MILASIAMKATASGAPSTGLMRGRAKVFGAKIWDTVSLFSWKNIGIPTIFLGATGLLVFKGHSPETYSPSSTNTYSPRNEASKSSPMKMDGDGSWNPFLLGRPPFSGATTVC